MEKAASHISPPDTYGKDKPMVRVKNLRKAFHRNEVLKGFDFELYPGENVVVLGRSGSGKSVLIKCIVRLIMPDSGSIRVFGQDVMKAKGKELNKLRERIGFVFQNSALYDSMTVRKNLEFALRHTPAYHDKQELARRVREALDDVGLEEAIDLMPAELSGGMRKRVGLARTLILHPSIIFYDEPTTGLDPVTAREITDLMLEVQHRYNTSSIIISHDMNCVEAVNTRVIMLAEGGAYAEGSYAELAASPDPVVNSFFK